MDEGALDHEMLAIMFVSAVEHRNNELLKKCLEFSGENLDPDYIDCVIRAFDGMREMQTKTQKNPADIEVFGNFSQNDIAIAENLYRHAIRLPENPDPAKRPAKAEDYGPLGGSAPKDKGPKP